MFFNTSNKICSTARLSVSVSQPNYHQHLPAQLTKLCGRHQWILFTAQCSRKDVIAIAENQIWANKAVHLMPSRQRSEFEVVSKAIRASNASAIIASEQLTPEQQHWLKTLARLHHCQLFFVDTTNARLH